MLRNRNCSARRSSNRLGCEALARPGAICLLAVLQAVVKTAGAPLPELDFIRDDAVAAPPARARHGLAVLLTRDVEAGFQRLPVYDRFALTRGIDAPPAFHRATREIFVGFRLADPLDASLHAHLAIHRPPEKQQAGAAGLFNLTGFAAVVVRVEDEAAGIDAFQQDGSH